MRWHFLDWVRVLAFALLIFYHAGLVFVDWGFHITNPERSEGLKLPLLFLNQWRLPLLFFVSGAGMRFALGRRTGGQFVEERLVRLLVPLVFGMLVVVPPQVYFEVKQRGRFSGSFLEFLPRFVLGGYWTWNHLWFLIYVLVFALLALPLFLRSRQRAQAGQPSLSARFFAGRGPRLLLLSLPLFATELLLRDSWPDSRNLVADWYNFGFYFLSFLYGYFVASHSPLWEVVQRQRWVFLLVGLTAFAAIYFGRHQSGRNFLETSVAGDLAFDLLKGLNVVAWIFCGLGFARRHLEVGGPVLRYANQAVYPFYILHQTVLIGIGYFLVATRLSLPSKYLLLVAGTFAGSLLLYELVRRTRITRLLFGMKD